MRHAVVVAPPRFALSPGNIFATPEPVGPLTATLSRGGMRVVVVPTSAELDADLGRALADVAPGEELLVHLATETTTGGADVAMVLGDEGWTPPRTLALHAVADRVAAAGLGAVLYVVEACHDGAENDPLFAAEHVEKIVAALGARARGHAVLVGVRPVVRASIGSWPFTRHVLYALQDPESKDASGATLVSRVAERLRADHPEQGQVQSFAFVAGAVDFVVTAPFDPGAARTSSPPSSRSSMPAPSTRSSHPPTSSRVSLPPPSLPAIEPLLALARGAHDRGAWDEALAGYKAALMVAPEGDAAGRANLYAHVADVKRAQGKAREAEANYEKALGEVPGHRASLDALVDLATESKEPRRAVDWRRKRLPSLATLGERVEELLGIARIQADELRDRRAAAEALEEAHAMAPEDRRVVEALRAAYEAMHRWPRVMELLAEAASLAADATERAAMRFAAADVALGRLRDEERGLALLERTLDDDPRHDKALQALVAVRTARAEWSILNATYARLVDRFAKLDDAARAWEACRKLGVLRRDRLHDVAGAIEAFTGAVSCKPSDVDSRTMLADLHLAVGDGTRAVAEFERVASLAPARASTYARLFTLHQKAMRTDRAWLVATAMEELGSVDVDAQLVVDQFRTAGPIRPARALDDAGWDAIRAPGADEVVAAILTAVGAAARAVQIDELKDARKLIALDPARRQDASSTVSAVRSFQWAAQVLGVEAPALYVIDAVPGGIAAVQSAEPSTVLGPDVLQGLGTKDLAFLAGRHLTYYRPEHLALVYYPTLAELSVLFLGAVKIALPDVPVPTALSESVGKMRKQLRKHLGDKDTAALAEAVARLDARDGRVDLHAWIRGVELTAQRAGLLLCGDLKTAMARLRAEIRTIADLDLDTKRADLLAMCASSAFAGVRSAVGVDARSSVMPPPVSQRDVGAP